VKTLKNDFDWCFWMWYLAIMLSLLVGPNMCARAGEDWELRDEVLFGSLVTLQVVDILQTREAMKHPEQFKEANPVFGDDPSTGKLVLIKGVYVGVVWHLLDEYTSSKDRTVALWVLNAIAAVVVLNNHLVGVRIEF